MNATPQPFQNSTAPSQNSTVKSRLVSLDQFRGYTVLGMLLVNYFGSFSVCPQVLRHSHDYCSYADTIMPQFLFAVGFSMRLTFGRREFSSPFGSVYGRMVRRLLGLAFVSLMIYQLQPQAANWEAFVARGWSGVLHEPLKRTWFQTLMHIAVTSLWILPVIRRGAMVRLVWMIVSGLAHLLLSYGFNFTWVNTPPVGIDGGPLGFLTWSIPALVGTLACDALVATKETQASFHPQWSRCLLWAGMLMGSGYLFSCGTRLYDVPQDRIADFKKEKLSETPVLPSPEQWKLKESGGLTAWLAEPPMIKPPNSEARKWNYWMMSQRSGTLSYLTFAAGFSLMIFLVFFVVCERYGWELSFFRTFGTNALLAYILHDVIVGNALQAFFPKDSPLPYALFGLGLFLSLNWVLVRHFEKQGIFLRV